MSGWTRRQKILAGIGLLLWALTVVAALLSWWPGLVISLSTLLLLTCLLVIDARATSAPLLVKLNRQLRRSASTERRLKSMGRDLHSVPDVVGKQMRSARRSVERSGAASLEEISTLKLSLAAVVQQLAEINLHSARAVSADELAGALDQRDGRLAGRLEQVRRHLDTAQAAEGLRLDQKLEHLGADVERLAYEPVREVEAMLQLLRRYEPSGVTPTAGGGR